MSLLEVAGQMSGDVFLGGELEPESSPPATDQVAPPAGATYIRGAGGQQTTDRRVGQITAWLCLVVVLATAVGLGFSAIRHDRQVSDLHSKGVPVIATVTSCLALASGTGVTADGFRCTATYSYAGQQHSEVLHNSYLQYARGQSVAAIVDPSHPGTVSLASAVEHRGSRSKPFITPIALLVCFVLGSAAMIRFQRKRSRAV